MRSHIHSRRDGAGAKSSPQGIGQTPNFLHPLRNCVHKSTFSITDIADLPASLLRMCEHTHGNGEGMWKSSCLHSATTPRIRERNYRLFKEGLTLATSILLESGVICLCQAARMFFRGMVCCIDDVSWHMIWVRPGTSLFYISDLSSLHDDGHMVGRGHCHCCGTVAFWLGMMLQIIFRIAPDVCTVNILLTSELPL